MGYDIALFFHISGVLALFVAVALEMTSLTRLRRSTSVSEAQTWASLISPLPVVYPVAIVVILGAGLFMLHDHYGSAQPWAMTALVILVALAILGALFNGRHMEAIHGALQAAPDGAIPDHIQRRIQDPVLLTSVQTMTTAILGIVLLMTVKPGLRDSLIIVAVTAIVGLASSQAVLRASPSSGAGKAPAIDEHGVVNTEG